MTTSAGSATGDSGRSSHGVRIGRIKGIPVYLAPSWFLIAVVIIALVSAPVLPTRPLFGIGVGIAQALLLLACVLVHEAAHALTARAFGMQVLRIVANLWGGHTSFEAVASSPGRLAVVAAAGPGANAAVAVASFVGLHASSGDLAGRLLEGLLIINGTLAVLNLLPGMPLDGGQVVECLVWKATGDRNRGAVVAGWSGRVVAAAVVLGFLGRPLLRGEGLGFGAVWTLVIGWVLWNGATESIKRGKALGLLSRLTVADVVEPAVYLPPGTPLSQALAQRGGVVTTDARGIPCLFLPTVNPQALAGLDPSAPLVSAVTRVPDENVVEAPATGAVTPVVAAMQTTGVGTVVVTQHGRPWAVAHARLVNEAAERNYTRRP
jgi:Zn-dependent protease